MSRPRKQGEKKPPSEDTGGYDYEFLEVPEELSCPVCLLVLREPHLTSCCGNHYCQSCIERLTKDRRPCPVCQATDFTVFLDKYFLRKVDDLKLVCPLGCQWVGELRSVARHIDPKSGECTAERPCKYDCGLSFPVRHLQGHHQVCPNRPYTCQYCRSHQSTYAKVTEVHWPKCPKYPLPCPFGCGSSPIQRKNMESHRSRCPKRPYTCQYCRVYQSTYVKVKDVHLPQCPKRPHTCPYCRGYQSTYINVKEVHWPQCPNFPLPCPNGCSSQTIQRRNLERHREVCPAAVVRCKYREVGCTAKVTRKSMDAHLKVAVHKHLSLMDDAYCDACDVADAFQKENLELKVTVQSLKQEILRLKGQ